MLNRNIAISVASLAYIFIFIFINSGNLSSIVGGFSNPIGFLFTPFGLSWLIFTLIAGGFLIFANYLMKSLGPKKIEMETYQRFSKGGVEKLKRNDPNFSAESFLTNCSKLASKLNTAWTKNNMNLVRNLVSSGIYNRFRLQLELMKEEGVENHMKNWFLDTIDLISVEIDPVYQTAHVEINARAKDVTLPLNTPKDEIEKSLTESPQEMYYEVWSFVRKTSAITKKDQGLLNGNCPNCGANIEDIGESNQCKQCKTVINSGEYDWVLAEITQKIEWKPGQSSGSIDLTSIREQNSSVNRQVIEDRASYLFWRWIEARVEGSFQPLKRYSSPKLLNSIQVKKDYIAEAAVGAVDLKNCLIEGEEISAKVQVVWSASFSKGQEPINRRNTLTLKLPIQSVISQGLSECSCNTCGAPLPESDSLKCEYCGDEIPPVVSDWLLDQIKEG
ncbi:MAG: TIM44-like domain-containing protein [Leptospiraceae bacterium]|nr:TIM44-like domain-containing protein [Leptospiraceae bacterium]